MLHQVPGHHNALDFVGAFEDLGELGVAEHAPLLLVERVSYSYGDRPVEVRRGLYVTEHYHYHNTLS